MFKPRKEHRWIPIDGTKETLGKTVFGVKLPISYENRLKVLPREEKVALMRSALMKAIDEYYAQNN